MSNLQIAEELFKGRHFDRGIVILCVRWHLRCKLSLRDLVEMMAERARPVDGACNHHPLGAALRTGVGETLASVCRGSQLVMAGRRDIHQDPRQAMLSVFVPLIGQTGRSTFGCAPSAISRPPSILS